MSSLLEQAIVDAAALKEAALKNAESAVLEKYSLEVKGALNTLLEQDGPDMGFVDEVPLAHEDEEIDGVSDDEMIEIDFDDLKARMDAEEAEGEEASPEEMINTEEAAQEIFADDPALAAAPLEMEAPPVSPELPLAEDITISDALIDALVEELTVDVSPQLGGWSPLASADTQEHVGEVADEEAAAAAQSEEVTEEYENNLKLYEAKIGELSRDLGGMRSLLIEAKDQLNNLMLENAKLLYQNKALNSASLNERQKEKIVEAVRNANTVEETKVLFETLQSAVGGRKIRRSESLREAVSRPTTSMLLSAADRGQATSTVDPNMDRMLRLAGLRKQ
tara:strand:+ start:2195 stop:3202 length:1008 start_codon:yes stop_codon:yes gene_type:complete